MVWLSGLAHNYYISQYTHDLAGEPYVSTLFLSACVMIILFVIVGNHPSNYLGQQDCTTDDCRMEAGHCTGDTPRGDTMKVDAFTPFVLRGNVVPIIDPMS